MASDGTEVLWNGKVREQVGVSAYLVGVGFSNCTEKHAFVNREEKNIPLIPQKHTHTSPRNGKAC